MARGSRNVRLDRSLGHWPFALTLLGFGLAGCPQDPHDVPRAPTSMAQPFDSTALRSALERIAGWHVIHKTQTAAALRPGLSESQLAQALGRLPCELPREIRAVYAWHDGTERVDAEFVWYHYFPNLEISIRNYGRLTGSGLLHPDEFPVLEFEGEYYVVRCSKLLVDASPVWLVHDNPERSVNYVSFTAYMQTAAEWYESGAAEAHDLHQLRAIHQRHNPGAQFPYAVE